VVDPRMSPAALRPVAMIVHAYYDEDPRVRREAEALVARGRPVDVYGLRRPGDPADGWLEGVRVKRLDVQRHQGAGFRVYLYEYLAFLVRVCLALVIAQPRRRYAVVQVAIVQPQPHIAVVRILVNVVEALGIERRRPPDQAVHRVALRQQQFGEVRAVLAGDSGHQRGLVAWGRVGHDPRLALAP